MSDIGPGDWVECAPPAGYRGDIPYAVAVRKTRGSYPKRGGIYQVRETGYYDGRLPGLRLVGIVVCLSVYHPDAWFPAECFRPIYRPKAEFIAQFAQPAPPEKVGA